MSLTFLIVLSLSVSTETKEISNSETEDGVLVDCGQAVFSLTPEQDTEIKPITFEKFE